MGECVHGVLRSCGAGEPGTTPTVRTQVNYAPNPSVPPSPIRIHSDPTLPDMARIDHRLRPPSSTRVRCDRRVCGSHLNLLRTLHKPPAIWMHSRTKVAPTAEIHKPRRLEEHQFSG